MKKKYVKKSNKSSPEKQKNSTNLDLDDQLKTPNYINLVKTQKNKVNRDDEMRKMEIFKKIKKELESFSPDSDFDKKQEICQLSKENSSNLNFDFQYWQDKHLMDKLEEIQKQGGHVKYFNDLMPETSSLEHYYQNMLLKYFTKKENVKIMEQANKIYAGRNSKSKTKILMMSSQNNTNRFSGFIKGGALSKEGTSQLSYLH